MTLLLSLRRQHQRILATLADIEPLCEDGSSLEQVQQLRIKMAWLLRWAMVHGAMQAEQLYPPMQWHADPAVRDAAARFGIELGPLMRQLDDAVVFLDQPIDGPQRADEVCVLTREMTRLLRDRIAREARLLLPLAENVAPPEQRHMQDDVVPTLN